MKTMKSTKVHRVGFQLSLQRSQWLSIFNILELSGIYMAIYAHSHSVVCGGI